MSRDSYPLRMLRVEVEPRRLYLHAVLRGRLDDVNDVARLGATLRSSLDRYSLRRVLIDARGLEAMPAPDACEAAWGWLRARSYEQLACVLPAEADDMVATRMNMTGVSGSIPFRVFPTILDAHRWLELRLSGERRISTLMGAVTPTPSRAPTTPSQGSPPTEVPPSGERSNEPRSLRDSGAFARTGAPPWRSGTGSED